MPLRTLAVSTLPEQFHRSYQATNTRMMFRSMPSTQARPSSRPPVLSIRRRLGVLCRVGEESSQSGASERCGWTNRRLLRAAYGGMITAVPEQRSDLIVCSGMHERVYLGDTSLRTQTHTIQFILARPKLTTRGIWMCVLAGYGEAHIVLMIIRLPFI